MPPIRKRINAKTAAGAFPQPSRIKESLKRTLKIFYFTALYGAHQRIAKAADSQTEEVFAKPLFTKDFLHDVIVQDGVFGRADATDGHVNGFNAQFGETGQQIIVPLNVPAGTGKTYLAIAYAISLLREHKIKKLIIMF